MLILEKGLTPELFHSQMQMIENVEGRGNRTGAVEQMKNIYGLNYTGAAVLYQNYQDKVKEYGNNKEGLEEYFNGGEWKEYLEKFKENPDHNNSTEQAMFSDVADIKKYTQQIGQWYLDNKIPEISELLKNVYLDTKEKDKTTDTGPGEQANPYPPAEPEPKPIEEIVQPPTVEKTIDSFRDTLRDPASTPEDIKNARIGWADASEEKVKRLDRIDEAKKIEESLYKKGGLFGRLAPTHPTLFTGNGYPISKNEDEEAYDNLQSFGKNKKDSEAYKNYLTSMDILGQFPDPIRDQLDKSNEINTVVNNSMTDKTGYDLVQALLALADKLNLDIVLD
jgi:hypothetical protein